MIDLPAFKKTVQWIDGTFNAESLPKIAVLQDAAFFSRELKRFVFKRKVEEIYPYMVGEFHNADHIYVFIIPFCTRGSLKTFLEVLNNDLHWFDLRAGQSEMIS